ncbi:hypothetical protein E2C01_017865 [Portunus trituberculatus]|uniref:Uncharacterized protein n=1 Tax=Portunus trituberculatus TaxID=210409 RepID=A0A5B7DSX8_PORTR|nr:hypothetical protein [Portunus trituberculatus]
MNTLIFTLSRSTQSELRGFGTRDVSTTTNHRVGDPPSKEPLHETTSLSYRLALTSAPPFSAAICCVVVALQKTVLADEGTILIIVGERTRLKRQFYSFPPPTTTTTTTTMAMPEPISLRDIQYLPGNNTNTSYHKSTPPLKPLSYDARSLPLPTPTPTWGPPLSGAGG